jgi:hypothetical protein
VVDLSRLARRCRRDWLAVFRVRVLEIDRSPCSGVIGPDDGLCDLLLQLSPSARDKLSAVLIRDQTDFDAIDSEPLRYGDTNGDGWAGVIDTLTIYPDVRRNVVRVLAEIDASLA